MTSPKSVRNPGSPCRPISSPTTSASFEAINTASSKKASHRWPSNSAGSPARRKRSFSMTGIKSAITDQRTTPRSRSTRPPRPVLTESWKSLRCAWPAPSCAPPGRRIASSVALLPEIEGFLALRWGRLSPRAQNGAHHQVTKQLIASVDREHLHALPGEQRSGELYRRHKADPGMEPDQCAGVRRLGAKPVQEQREHKRRNHAGCQRARISREFRPLPGFGCVVRVVSHLLHPRFCKRQRRIPQKSDQHRRKRCRQYGQEIKVMKRHRVSSS